MKYHNPIIPGFYPDPSICRAGDTFYLVCSSFQYFPGVPLFESRDLVNWKQIGHVLTRESQLPLGAAGVSEGIYAPTIRYHNGRFYMVTTNVVINKNFYVWTDDIHGEWSEPVFVEQDGIDPSFYFEDGKAYFMSNGTDADGKHGVVQCEIDIDTGKKLTASQCIWQGAGGRFLESPHLYKINDTYYLMAAEGGTEYGHMVVYAKGGSPYGPFINYPGNPVLTNRNLGGYEIQGCGHADIIQDNAGNWWMVHLAFRQLGKWITHHVTGREVYLVPVTFEKDGWFTAGENGTTPAEVETGCIPEEAVQQKLPVYTFANTKAGREWCFLRNPHMENYRLETDRFCLKGTCVTLEERSGSPTFTALRQRELNGCITCNVTLQRQPEGVEQEAGLTMYMDEEHHYDVGIRQTVKGLEVFKRACIGDIKYIQQSVLLEETVLPVTAALTVRMTNEAYVFETASGGKKWELGRNRTRYISTETVGGFTGVMIGLYAQSFGGECREFTEFTEFTCAYSTD